MITKEQAQTELYFKEITKISLNPPLNTRFKQIKWRANGKCKTWKRDPDRFQLPVKNGLCRYGYITNDNCHLIELDI